MNTYVAGFNGKKTTIEAESLYEAKTKAIAALTPPKRLAHMVWVMLAQIDGKAVKHCTSSL